jgi:hypothetical protein
VRNATRDEPGEPDGRLLALGAVTRTGAMTLIAVTSVAGRPAFAGRWEYPLVPDDLPAQPYHAAAGLEAAAAEAVVERAESAAEQAALAALRSAVADLGAAAEVAGVAVVVKAVSVPDTVSAVLRSHAWMHAAEGVLYREAVLAAARRSGWAAHAADAVALPPADEILADLGTAAGRPWRRMEKDAARAALTLLRPGNHGSRARPFIA